MANELYNQTLETSIESDDRISFGKPSQSGCHNILYSVFKTFLGTGTLTGTANQVTLSDSGANALLGNSIQLSLPQDIATNSSVQFAKLGLGVAPTYQLHLKNTGNEANNIVLEAAGSTDLLHNLSTDENGGAIYMLYGADGANKVYISADGSSWITNSLGLGTNAPAKKLHLHSPTSSTEILSKYTIATTAEDGLLIGLNSIGEGWLHLVQNNSLKLGTNNHTRLIIENDGDFQFLCGGSTRPMLYLDNTNQYIYIKPFGADAISTATQKSSGRLLLQTSNWTGSAETKATFEIQSVASTSVDNSNTLNFFYNNSQIAALSSSGTFTGARIVGRAANSGTANLITLTNSNSTDGNNASIDNYQSTSSKITGAIRFVNTSHNATTGTCDVTISGCPSGGSLTELLRLTSGGLLGIGITPTSKLHLNSGTAATEVYANWSIATTAASGLKIGLDTSGNAVVNQVENKPLTILTNNSTRITIASTGTITVADLAGTGQRIVEASAAGLLTATETIIAGKLSDSTAITLLTTGGNWTGVNYTGTAITGTYEGQEYDDGTYYYYAYSDNDWRRVARS
jgi:hypothetical protein